MNGNLESTNSIYGHEIKSEKSPRVAHEVISSPDPRRSPIDNNYQPLPSPLPTPDLASGDPLIVKNGFRGRELGLESETDYLDSSSSLVQEREAILSKLHGNQTNSRGLDDLKEFDEYNNVSAWEKEERNNVGSRDDLPADLSPEEISQLVESAKESKSNNLSKERNQDPTNSSPRFRDSSQSLQGTKSNSHLINSHFVTPRTSAKSSEEAKKELSRPHRLTIDVKESHSQDSTYLDSRPTSLYRALSTPVTVRSPLPPRGTEKARSTSIANGDPPKKDASKLRPNSSSVRPLPSPMPSSIPLPPLSLPMYLQLELSSQRPSQSYIHRSTINDFPYESSRVKIERLQNFLLLPFHLESVLLFGTLACLDSWLYTFTILPLRLLKSFYILGQSWSVNIGAEIHFMSNFVYNGTGRMWQRQRGRKASITSQKQAKSDPSMAKTPSETPTRARQRLKNYHQRQKSVPSTLLPDDKADILKGLLIISTCLILLRFDASRMYHWIRGQAAIKLYVIYNVLEVCDRLFSAIGQDVLECLFSRETLERKPDGHSKVLRPLWLFTLALVYTVIHSTALFYQVITLNVAVNSYSNALITLLMSNQFVEIKSTVFKKFEKENLFQLTCADVVERFQLWHMLVIIASRNIVESGGHSQGFNIFSTSNLVPSAGPNNTSPLTQAIPPRTVSSILPRAFTLVPSVVTSISAYVPTIGSIIGPFMVVLGSEMLVDWIKHAYINKFNNTRPAIYGRFLDVLAKDYYTNAFEEQNLTKRLGLPVIPLSCLLIRASVQTYQMFMAAWVPSTPATLSTNLAKLHEEYSTTRSTIPATTSGVVLATLDDWLSNIPSYVASSRVASYFTTVTICLLGFLILLACKLVLGMLLLAYSRSRYRSMKEREKNSIQHVEGGRRVGGWGVVEVDEDKRRWIYEDDPSGLRALRDREERERLKVEKEKDKDKGNGTDTFDRVKRYEMSAKRIW